MSRTTLQLLMTAPNIPTAQVIADLLGQQGILCHIDSGTPLLGQAQMCAILVEGSLLDRAKRLLSQTSFTDAELEFLATGHLSCDAAKE